MNLPRRIRGCYQHFCLRVGERIEGGVSAHSLWLALIDGIEGEDGTVQYIARINRSGRRLWRFDVDGTPYFAIYDHDLKCPITVFPPRGSVRRHASLPGGPIDLEAYI